MDCGPGKDARITNKETISDDKLGVMNLTDL